MLELELPEGWRYRWLRSGLLNGLFWCFVFPFTVIPFLIFLSPEIFFRGFFSALFTDLPANYWNGDNLKPLVYLLVIWAVSLLIEIVLLRRYLLHQLPPQSRGRGFVYLIGRSLLLSCIPLSFALACMALPGPNLAYWTLWTVLALGFLLRGLWLRTGKRLPLVIRGETFERKRDLVPPPVLVIQSILLLFLLMLPHFIGADSRAKISSVKANMHSFQTMVETYGVDNDGVYPKDVQTLKQAADVQTPEASAYWKDFSNPYTNQQGQGLSYANLQDFLPKGVAPQDFSPENSPQHWQFAGLQFKNPERLRYSGMVLYLRTGPRHYAIYGSSKDGSLIQDKGQSFYLTNSY